MHGYNIGDTFVFSTSNNVEWLLVEINEKTYKFIDLWDPHRIWLSHKTAPVHNIIGLKIHRRGGITI